MRVIPGLATKLKRASIGVLARTVVLIGDLKFPMELSRLEKDSFESRNPRIVRHVELVLVNYLLHERRVQQSSKQENEHMTFNSKLTMSVALESHAVAIRRNN